MAQGFFFNPEISKTPGKSHAWPITTECCAYGTRLRAELHGSQAWNSVFKQRHEIKPAFVCNNIMTSNNGSDLLLSPFTVEQHPDWSLLTNKTQGHCAFLLTYQQQDITICL